MDAIRAANEDTPTTELLSGAVGDRCANCQAALASDQRYCVSCGARRGKGRFSAASLGADPAPASGGSSERQPPHRSRVSSGATLVAGIATLLIAMGVGVLIGHDSNTTPIRAASPEVITVGGGAAGTGAGSTGSSASSAKASKGKVKVTKVKVTAKTAAAASKAASQVLGAGAPKNPTVQPGQACTAGTAGCQNGKFTGDFFGGG